MISLDATTSHVLETLTQNGYQAYVVGGYVRDALLGMQSQDVDICTDAHPDKVWELFADETLSETGIRYGNVRFDKEGFSYEITTFRHEAEYHDGRHPERVVFVDDLETDLRRRDFTINALCYHPETGVIDRYNGLDDLKRKRIRTIGDPAVRFQEDGLRILRLFRFAATLDFAIDPQTLRAAEFNAEGLKKLTFPQIKQEFLRFICTSGFLKIALLYPWVLGAIIPELYEASMFDQKNSYHLYSLYEHTVRVIDDLPQRWDLRLVGLFHDLGKLRVQTIDEEGVGHYPDHAHASRDIAEVYLKRFQISKKTRSYLLSLIESHDLKIHADQVSIQRLVYEKGVDWVRDLILLKRADNIAKSDKAFYQVEKTVIFEQFLNNLLASKAVISISDLDIDAEDLHMIGVADSEIKYILRHLVYNVIDLKVENRKEALLTFVKEQMKNELY